MTLDELFDIPPFSLNKADKQTLLVEHLNRLNAHHAKSCNQYRKILRAMGYLGKDSNNIDALPFLPIRLFKQFDLKSVADSDVIKTLTSSGTTSAQVSRIFLDRDTSRYQTKALAVIAQDFVGRKRLPMLIIDSKNVIKDRKLFSARGAGILGMSNLGRNHLYLLDEKMNPDWEALSSFLDKHLGEDLLLFGFTFMVWQHFYQELKKRAKRVDLSRGILIHSGGWKKLAEQAVDNNTFRQSLKDVCGLARVHNFYGMVEQTGSVFVECEHGHLHAPVYADIIIRSPEDWSSLPAGTEGVIELLSILPHSYPGHILLTEDMGVTLGEDDCPCSRLGKYFRITGRIPKAEVRGCSDTYEPQEVDHAV